MSEFKGMLRLIGDQTTLPAAVEVATGEIHIRSSDTDLGRWALSDVAIEERVDGFLLTVDDGQLLLTPFDRAGFAESMTVETKVASKAARKRGRRRRKSSDLPKAQSEPPTQSEPTTTPEEAIPISPTPSAEPAEDAEQARRRRWTRRRDRSDTPDATEASVSPYVEEPPPAPSAPTTEAEDEPGIAARVAGRLAASTGRERIVGAAVLAVLLLAVFAARVLTILVLVGGGLVVLLGILAYVDDYVAVKIPSPWTPLRVIGLGLGVLAAGGVIPLVLL